MGYQMNPRELYYIARSTFYSYGMGLEAFVRVCQLKVREICDLLSEEWQWVRLYRGTSALGLLRSPGVQEAALYGKTMKGTK